MRGDKGRKKKKDDVAYYFFVYYTYYLAIARAPTSLIAVHAKQINSSSTHLPRAIAPTSVTFEGVGSKY